MQLSWALAHIGVLKAAVMARPRADHCSAGLGASSNTVAYAECSRNFGDCSGESRGGDVEMVSNMTVQPSPAMREVPHMMCRLMLEMRMRG